MDAITLLRDDHKTVEGLFKKFEKAGPTAKKTKRDLVDKIVTELAVHAAIEELVFYPAVRQALPDASDEVLEGLEEHHVVKWTLSELADMAPAHERFDPKMRVLIESVRHHAKEEEDELFPQVRDAFTVQQLEEMGEALEKAKETAPTLPHPRMPDTPPFNVLLGLPASVLDKAIKTGRDAVERVMKKAS